MMDESETYANIRLTGTDPQAPSRAEPDVSYVELNVTALSAPRVRRYGGGLNSTYAEVNVPNDEPVIDEDEAPPIAAGPRELPNNAQTAVWHLSCSRATKTEPKSESLLADVLYNWDVTSRLPFSVSRLMKANVSNTFFTSLSTSTHEQQPEVKIGNRPYRLSCLLCLVTSALIVTVAGLSIHGMHSDLRHQFTEIEMKYKSDNETKAQICELLTSRREQACSKDWIRNEDRCYFISKFKRSYDEAMQYCSNSDSKLLEINSREKEIFANSAARHEDIPYWIAACISRKVASDVAYKMNAGKSECSECKPSWISSCKNDQHRFICEKPASLCPTIPEKFRDLCQKPVEPT
ncbi:uncharacterized protein [Hemitrygon akajei]|uniref:uncharacterized protein n=1 Tax=Hemitrygon akajei TaxID=2704970 RepID=UPI003BF9569A